MNLSHQESLDLIDAIRKVAVSDNEAKYNCMGKLETIVTLIAVFMSSQKETRISVDLLKSQSDSILLMEHILEIVQHKNIIASTDAERLFQIRLLIVQFLDNN